MDRGTYRAVLIALLIAAVGLAACVVRTTPAHRHRHQHVESHQKHKPQKHKKHKKHKNDHRHH